jgi:hypothetical protein
MPVASGMTAADTEAVSKLMTNICWSGQLGDPVYLMSQKVHADKLETHLAIGSTMENFKCRIRPRLLDRLNMQFSKLSYFLDPRGTCNQASSC